MTIPQDKTAALESAQSKLIECAANLATGKYSLSDDQSDWSVKVPSSVLRQIEKQNDRLGGLAVVIKNQVDKISAALLQPAWQEMPKGWHVSWMGEDDGSFLCQIKRHDNDLDYLSDISFVSRKSLVSMQQAYNFAIDEVLKSYSPPPTDIDSGEG